MGTENTYGAPVGYQPPITSDRPVAREADPMVRRQALAAMQRQAIAEAQARAQSRPAPVAAAAPADSPTRDLSILTAIRRLIDRKANIDRTLEGM